MRYDLIIDNVVVFRADTKKECHVNSKYYNNCNYSYYIYDTLKKINYEYSTISHKLIELSK